MSGLVLLLLILGMTGHSDANWCTCRSDVSDSALQKALDYACGSGADCTPILQNGPCFQPNTVRAHCSYAVNSYFQKKGQAQGTCEFASAATPTATDPSPGGSCVFPSSGSSTGTGTGIGTGTSTSTNPTNTPSSSTSANPTTSTTPPSAFNPNNPTTGGVMSGGIGAGLGPTGGTGISTDASDALHNSNLLSLLVLISGMLFLLS